MSPKRTAIDKGNIQSEIRNYHIMSILEKSKKLYIYSDTISMITKVFNLHVCTYMCVLAQVYEHIYNYIN